MSFYFDDFQDTFDDDDAQDDDQVMRATTLFLSIFILTTQLPLSLDNHL